MVYDNAPSSFVNISKCNTWDIISNQNFPIFYAVYIYTVIFISIVFASVD